MSGIMVVRQGALVPVRSEQVQLFTFAGGEPHVNVHDAAAVVGEDVVVDVRSGTFDALGAALVAADAARRSGASTVSLALSYLPAARQDRGVPFTAKVVADVVNQARFDHVVGVDPHSLVMPALLERFTAVEAVDVFPVELVERCRRAVVVCPDAGAVRRAHAVADRFGLDVVHARKRRDPATGRLSGFVCEPLPGDAVGVVVDDICDGGATFVGLADALGCPPDRLRLWTTHGIYARGVGHLHERFSVLATSDSLPTSRSADVVVPLAPVLGATFSRLLRRPQPVPQEVMS